MVVAAERALEIPSNSSLGKEPPLEQRHEHVRYHPAFDSCRFDETRADVLLPG